MDCTNCGDDIDTSTDTFYESVRPAPGGSGQTTTEYCSVACLNENAGFSDDEIESLMRQANYEVPPELESDWVVHLQSEINDLALNNHPTNGEYFTLFVHVEKDYDIEVFHNAHDQYYEVILYTYTRDDEGNKVGLEEIEEKHTALHQRAIAYAESFMEQVEDM